MTGLTPLEGDPAPGAGRPRAGGARPGECLPHPGTGGADPP